MAGDRSSSALPKRRGRRGVPPDVQQALQEFSHDIRHSVGTILMLVDGGRHDTDACSELARFLDGIEFEADSIAALCRAILGDASEQRRTRVDQVTKRVVAAATSGFDGTIEVALEPASVTGDELALVRMLRNLLDNACRAAGPKGRVGVRVRELGGTVWIEVCDSGPGFGQVQPLQGLGLAIVQSAAHVLRGCVTFVEAPSGGTEIVVTIPTTNEGAERPVNPVAGTGTPDVASSCP